MSEPTYLKYEFVGYVTKIMKNKFGRDLVCRTAKDESDIKYPQHCLFSMSKKNEEKVPADLKPNDKVCIQFMPILAEGVSEKTHREYHINKLMLQECEIVERAPVEEPKSDPEDVEDLPF